VERESGRYSVAKRCGLQMGMRIDFLKPRVKKTQTMMEQQIWLEWQLYESIDWKNLNLSLQA
jgi:hypothetical protein